LKNGFKNVFLFKSPNFTKIKKIVLGLGKRDKHKKAQQAFLKGKKNKKSKLKIGL
jgi:hypothetical protein